MNDKRLFPVIAAIVLSIFIQACGSGVPTLTTGTPVSQPAANTPGVPTPGVSQETQAPPPARSGGVRLLIQGLDNNLLLVDTNGQSSPFVQADRPFNSPVFQNYSSSRTVGRNLYGASIGDDGRSQAFVIDPNGVRPLEYIQNLGLGFAVWPGSDTQLPRLAWDQQENNPEKNTLSSKLFAANTDGSDMHVLLEEPGPERVLVAGRWSPDGQRLYFSKEPVGLGGYILFGGASNLWAYNMADGSTAQVMNEPGMACIDEFSYDERLLAHHCANPTITVIQIASGAATTINPPSQGVEANFVGSARFSPDGARVAFGIARGDPNNEQGWVAVSDGFSGESRLIATAPAGDYFHVVGWMDANTLVLQSWGVKPGVWLVKADGSDLKRIADGVYHGLISGG